MSRSAKMYKDSPKLERNEGGKMAVKKRAKADAVAAGTEGVHLGGEDGLPMPARHAMERQQMHGRHEAEHAMHDHGKGGDKAEMHERHSKEMHDMHKRHHKEMMKGEAGHEKGGGSEAKTEKAAEGSEAEKSGEAKIEKVEKDKKE